VRVSQKRAHSRGSLSGLKKLKYVVISRYFVAKGTVKTVLVGIHLPCFDLVSSILQGQEPVYIQALAPEEAADKRFSEGIVRRLPQPGKVHGHPIFGSKPLQGFRDELRAVVATDAPGGVPRCSKPPSSEDHQ